VSKHKEYSTTNNPSARDFGTWELSGIYADVGCGIHSQCLSCPLPSCIYDLDVSDTKRGGFVRFAKIYPLVQQTQDPEGLAKLAGTNIRTAYRHIKRYKDADGDFAKFIGVDTHPHISQKD
jgi:hypothetical protein